MAALMTSEPRADAADAGHIARRLHHEFGRVLDASTIEHTISDTRQLLAGRDRGDQPQAVESLARDRLRAQLSRTKPAVLFLCVHNAGRSQMAAGWLRHLAGDTVEVFSGGSAPASEINQQAVAVMSEAGVDIRGYHPQPWTDEIARVADVIITMGCGDACPVVPGARYEDWVVRDPAEQPIEVVRDICNDIRARVERLIREMGLSE